MSNVTKLPPASGLGPPPDYFDAEQVRAWEDFVQILPTEARNAMYRGPIEICVLAIWAARKHGSMDPETQAAFRGFVSDLRVSEAALGTLGLPPLGNVYPI